jgi:hypothetical protein
MTTTSNHGQGAVRNPAQDGRLKDNKPATASNSNTSASRSTTHASHGQGAVKNPATDGRTKDKR